MAGADRAHRVPVGRQPERRAGRLPAEHRARHPAGAEALHGQGDEQVLHGRPHGDHEHLPFGGVAALVRVGVRRLGVQARDDEQRRPVKRLATP